MLSTKKQFRPAIFKIKAYWKPGRTFVIQQQEQKVNSIDRLAGDILNLNFQVSKPMFSLSQIPNRHDLDGQFVADIEHLQSPGSQIMFVAFALSGAYVSVGNGKQQIQYSAADRGVFALHIRSPPLVPKLMD